MRTCIVFRGENLRYKRGLTSALECVDNWKETIFDVIECDVAFFTYPSDILEELIEILSPVHVCTSGYDSQDTNVLAATNWMIENNDKYDRFVLLRFDFMYRLRINKWPQWDKKGITFVNKLVWYPTKKLLMDNVFIIDTEWIHDFKQSLLFEDPYRDHFHRIGVYLEERNVPLHLMYPGYYGILKNPLHALHPDEAKPNLNDYYQGEEIFDVSPWNPDLTITNRVVNTRIVHQQKDTHTHTRTRPYVIFKKRK